jgi:hypothetical protein
MITNSVTSKIEEWLSIHPDFIFGMAFFGLVVGTIGGAIAFSHHFVWIS